MPEWQYKLPGTPRARRVNNSGYASASGRERQWAQRLYCTAASHRAYACAAHYTALGSIFIVPRAAKRPEALAKGWPTLVLRSRKEMSWANFGPGMGFAPVPESGGQGRLCYRDS